MTGLHMPEGGVVLSANGEGGSSGSGEITRTSPDVSGALGSSAVSDTIEPADAKGWQDFANCLGVDPDLFFPERGASTREAKECCKGCVVREDCLEYALANGEKFGIWGGLSERERRRIRRQRAMARRTALEAEETLVKDTVTATD